jgi:uncharacterized protein YfaA (DUF2138 family)
LKAPPEKPSVFWGEYFPPEHSIRMRKRLLAAVLKEYISAECLAEDILEWLWRGKEEDIRRFVVTLMHRIGWLKTVPKTVEAAQTTPIRKVENEVLIMGESGSPG